LATPPEGGAESDGVPPRSYKFFSASYADKAYSDGTVLFYGEENEIELRQSTGKRKKEEAVIARFRVEPNAEVKVDGPFLKVSELSITLESPDLAGEVAELLRRPGKQKEEVTLLNEAESSVGVFLEARGEAMGLLSLMKVDPRRAMVSVESTWTADDAEPVDAVYSAYSARLAESLEKMTTFLNEAEKNLGSGVTNRLYALAYTIGAVQNTLFEADPDLTQELAALQELGVATTAQDLKMDKSTERLMIRAHPTLEALAAARAPSK
jgi:hypothetical protein